MSTQPVADDPISHYTSRRSTVYALHGVVATSQPLAAQAGLRILQEGGNAADAAIATAAMLNVVEPMSTGVGGDCFALYWDAQTKQITALNGSGRAPAAASPEELTRQGLTSIPVNGAYPVTVPGTVDGWATFLQRHGRMALADVLQPAIETAEQGFPVSEIIARSWQNALYKLNVVPSSGRELLLNESRPPRAGEVMRLPTLARTLKDIAAGGRDAFYHGLLAERIAAFVQALGGWLDASDLAAHTSTWDEPISTLYRDTTVWECPPNGQGLAALLALNLAAGYDLAAWGLGAPNRWHVLIEAMHLAFADAHRYIADPRVRAVPVAGLLSREYTERRRQLIQHETAMPSVPFGVPPGARLGDTVYLATADADGNACSFINSLYAGFGSGLVVPGTGICLQNRGACFNLTPGHPNRLEPGKRPYHTIIPCMATRDGKLFMAYGVMGGFMQPQGHLQVTVNIVDHGMDPQRALDAPRFRVDGNTVAIEESAGQEIISELARRGHRLSVVSGWERIGFGGGQIIRRDAESGVWAAGSEPRKDGAAVGY